MGRWEAEGGPDPPSQPLVLPQAVLGLQGGRRRAPDIPPGLERKTHHPSLGSTTPANLGLTGHLLPRQGPGKVCPPPGPVVWGPRGGWKPFSDPSHFPPSRRDLWGAWLCARCPPPTPPTLSGPRDVKTVSTCSALPGRYPICLPGDPFQRGFPRGACLLGICCWEPHGAQGVLPGQGVRNRLQVILRCWEGRGQRAVGAWSGCGAEPPEAWAPRLLMGK